MEDALKISDLSYGYKSNWLGAPFLALKDLSLTVNQGEAFGFLGHNGAGKTTAIKCALGLIKPSKGSILICGVDSQQTSARKQVGYLPEQPYFYDHLRVLETVDMYACLAGVSKKTRAARVEQALADVKLLSKKLSPIKALSKGLLQRVAMAQALVAGPRVLILDEPFSGLDPIGRKEFRELLLKLKLEGVTIFMSSHILSDVEYLCDRAAILSKGELKGVFSLKELNINTPCSFELEVENCQKAVAVLEKITYPDNINENTITFRIAEQRQAELLLKAVVDNGFGLKSFREIRGTLEDLFLKLVKFDEAKGN